MAVEQLAETVLSITDDSGFLALVNTEKYSAFIGGNWTLEQLKQRFGQEAKARTLFIWTTEEEGFYNVAVLQHQTDRTAIREFHGEIEVTNECLYLTNYDDLTMAAQFEDENLPATHSRDLVISLPNGIYKILVRQLLNLNNAMEQKESIAFEITLTAIV